MPKAASDRVQLRRKTWYYIRRVPQALAAFDSRVLVRISLKAEDRPSACKRAVRIEEALENLWASMLQNKSKNEQERYQEAIKRVQLEGFTYKPMEALVESKFEELAARLETLEHQTPVKVDTESILAAASALNTALPLSEALQRYYEFTKKEIIGKRPDQIGRWKNPRESAVKNFIHVIGDDKPIQNITRADTRMFRDWWLERIRKENLSPNSANKQLKYISRILIVINEEMALGLESVFSKLTLREEKKARPLFSRKDVEEVLLRPGALSTLNLEARSALFMCFETGMGTEEVTSLLPEDIRLDHEVPHIRIVSRKGSEQKTEYRQREIPLVGISLMAA